MSDTSNHSERRMYDARDSRLLVGASCAIMIITLTLLAIDLKRVRVGFYLFTLNLSM